MASSKLIITIGIEPTYPETGYGYIQYGSNKKMDVKGVYKVKTFAEKPEKETADKFIRSGEFLWNAGMFVWKAEIKLYNDIPSSYGAYYAGWSRSTSSPGNHVVGIHHADGDIKKISYDAYGMGSSGNWWDFGYSSGRVIPGSSGSPFFDSNKHHKNWECHYSI